MGALPEPKLHGSRLGAAALTKCPTDPDNVRSNRHRQESTRPVFRGKRPFTERFLSPSMGPTEMGALPIELTRQRCTLPWMTSQRACEGSSGTAVPTSSTGRSKGSSAILQLAQFHSPVYARAHS